MAVEDSESIATINQELESIQVTNPEIKTKKKKPKKKKKVVNQQGIQTEPPTIPVATLFPNGLYPIGELQDYKEEY
jgi:hypothetical protein